MKSIGTLLILATMLTGAATVQATSDGMGATKPLDTTGKDTAMANPADLTEGEVRKVDRDAKKITLKHGEIKNLDMPPMTMVFQVHAPSMLDELEAGDKVRFKVVSEAGKMTVTEIVRVP